jgi:uncharacterized protein
MVGGMMPIPGEVRPSGARPDWFGYIGVDDVDAYAGRVVEAGGKVHRGPHDIPGVGRFAVAADPHGATFILFTPNRGEERAQVAAGTPGHVGWRELYAEMANTPAPFWLYYFNVEAIDAAAARVTEAGGKVLMGPQQVPGELWIIQCTDPQGAMFALLSAKR